MGSQIIPQIKEMINASKEGGEKLAIDLETCESLLIDDFKLTYEATDTRLEKLESIV